MTLYGCIGIRFAYVERFSDNGFKILKKFPFCRANLIQIKSEGHQYKNEYGIQLKSFYLTNAINMPNICGYSWIPHTP